MGAINLVGDSTPGKCFAPLYTIPGAFSPLNGRMKLKRSHYPCYKLLPMTLVKTQTPLNTWLPATWEEFINIADDSTSAKLKSYYYIGRMRFEPMSTGSAHSNDHALIIFAISLFAASQHVSMTAKDGCSYRQTGFDEFQPDASYIADPADDRLNQALGDSLVPQVRTAQGFANAAYTPYENHCILKIRCFHF